MTLRLLKRYLLEPVQLFCFVPVIGMVIMIPAYGIVFALPLLSSGVLFLMRQLRASTFEASLPISARNFVTARALSTLLWTWLTLGIWLLVWHIREIHTYDQSAINQFLGGGDLLNVRIATFIAAVSIVMLMPLLIRPKLLTSPPIWLIALAIPCLAGICAAAMQFLPPIFAFALIFALFAVAIFRIVRGTPESFQFVSLTTSRHDTATSAIARNSANASWLAPLFRSIATPWLVASFVMMTFGGATGIWLTLFCIGLGTTVTLTHTRINWLRSLPISTRAQFLLLITPILAANVGGFALGKIVGEPLLPSELQSMSAWGPTRSTGNKYDRNETNISIAYWQIAAKSSLPVVKSPWGETTIADTISFFGTTFFNPYASSKVNTKRFFDWQIERATEAVYGFRIPAAQYNPEGVLPRRITRSLRMMILNVSLAITFGLFLVFLAELARWRKASSNIWLINLTAVPVGFIPLTVMVIDSLYRPGRSTQFIIPLTERFLLRNLHSFPSNPVVLLLIAFIPVLAMYALAEWQFGQGENLSGRSRATATPAQPKDQEVAVVASALKR